jgi:hypothetical protein
MGGLPSFGLCTAAYAAFLQALAELFMPSPTRVVVPIDSQDPTAWTHALAYATRELDRAAETASPNPPWGGSGFPPTKFGLICTPRKLGQPIGRWQSCGIALAEPREPLRARDSSGCTPSCTPVAFRKVARGRARRQHIENALDHPPVVHPSRSLARNEADVALLRGGIRRDQLRLLPERTEK